MDFTDPGTVTVTFTSGTTLPNTQCTSISTTQDNILEGDHAFSATITDTSADPVTAVIISELLSTLEIVINDDESKANNYTLNVDSKCLVLNMINFATLPLFGKMYVCDASLSFLFVPRCCNDYF